MFARTSKILKFTIGLHSLYKVKGHDTSICTAFYKITKGPKSLQSNSFDKFK